MEAVAKSHEYHEIIEGLNMNWLGVRSLAFRGVGHALSADMLEEASWIVDVLRIQYCISSWNPGKELASKKNTLKNKKYNEMNKTIFDDWLIDNWPWNYMIYDVF